MPILDVHAAGIYFVETDPEISPLPNITSDVCGMLAVLERGRFGAYLTTKFPDWVNEYGGYTTDSIDGAVAAMAYFENGGRTLWTVRITHYTDLTDPATRQSALATININSAAAATAGGITTGNPENFFLFAGGTLEIKVDGGGAQTVTWDATSGSRTGSGGTYPTGFSGGETLILNIDNEPINRTITFTAAESTLVQVVNFINKAGILPGGSAEDSGSELMLTSDSKGTGSRMEVVGGTGAATLGMAVGVTAGTGDVADIEDVTAAEVVARIIADTTLTSSEVFAAAGAVTINTPTLGASGSIQIDATSTLDDATYLDLDNAVHSGSDAGSGVMGRIDGSSEGDWINGWTWDVTAASNGDGDYFDAELKDDSGIRKGYWANCITTVADPDNWLDKINNDATNFYIVATDDLTGTPPANRPTNGTYTLAGGDNGLSSLADSDFTGNAAGPTGLYQLDPVENLRTLFVPGKSTSAVHNAMVTYCDTWRNRFVQAILDPAEGQTADQIRTYVVTTASLKGSSDTAMITWPRGQILNPRPAVISNDEDDRITVPLSGHIAGRWAFVDGNVIGGVYDVPAGVVRGKLGGVLKMETDEVDDERKRGLVYDDLICPIRMGSGGAFIDGNRMLKANGNFPTVNQRRGTSQVMHTLRQGLDWVAHSRIKRSLLRKVDRSARTWLEGETRIGAFASDKAEEAFRLNVSAEINPAALASQRSIRVKLGLAWAEPNDFTFVEVSKDTRAIDELNSV